MTTGARAYTIQSGDTLWGIAHRTYGHGALWPVIFVYNQQQNLPHPNPRKLVDPDKIYINQVIYLPDRIDRALLKRGPGQVSVPGPIRETAPATHPGQLALGQNGAARAGGGLATLLNDFSVRFDVSRTLLKRKIGQFEVEIQFKGYIALRHDKLVPASTFTNKAYENQRKMELGHALGDLIATQKLKIAWGTGKIEYECLLTAHAWNGKPLPVSTGIALDKSVPPLAWRTKIDLADASGHWRDIIYRTENLTIQITVRWKPDSKTANPGGNAAISLVPATAVTLAQAAPVPAPATAPTPAPVPAQAPGAAPAAAPPLVAPLTQNDPTSTPDTGDYEGEGWLARQWHWVEHHPAEVAAAVVVVAVVVAAAPEIAAAVGSGMLVRGAAAAAAGLVVTRMATPARPGPGV